MTTPRLVAALFALVMLPAMAPAADDIAVLRAELQALKDDYRARVGALEEKIQKLEAHPVASNAPPPEPPPAAPTGGSASAFNPAMSLILGGSFTNTSRDPGDWHIAGFFPAGEESGPGERSFNLGESELTLSASIDPYFSGVLTAAITGDNEIEVEEAFFRTTALRNGLIIKGGRFFSGFGYLNEVHAHAWDFVDQPLVYQAMFGGQYRQDGVQVKWLAPTDIFLEFGVETGNGNAYPATRLERNGFNGATWFGHIGADLGTSASWRAGVSWLTQKAENREGGLGADEVLFDSFTGDSDTLVVDGVFKWAPAPRRTLEVQGEYMRRKEDGTLVYDPAALAALVNYDNEQSGWYLQGVYQFAPRWRAGVRYDSLDSGNPRVSPVSIDPPIEFAPGDAMHPDRLSVMLDWNPSEFSRLRAQYDWDDSRDDGDTDRVLRLQYIYGLGAHGAHKY
jgi:hypothetical protein